VKNSGKSGVRLDLRQAGERANVEERVNFGGQVLPAGKSSRIRVAINPIVGVPRGHFWLLGRGAAGNVNVMSLFSASGRCSAARNATMMFWFRRLSGQIISFDRFLRSAKMPDATSPREE
jgi:hypothetical protein